MAVALGHATPANTLNLASRTATTSHFQDESESSQVWYMNMNLSPFAVDLGPEVDPKNPDRPRSPNQGVLYYMYIYTHLKSY